MIAPFDDTLDLRFERIVPVRRALVWKCWTEPEHLKHWFVPRPWTLAECEVDLRPGGRFRTVMRSPEGELMPGDGCYLDVVTEERLVWTDALLPGFRPSMEPFFTGVLVLEDHPEGTRYVARAIHGNPEKAAQHREMGFEHGWGSALDQLVEYAGKAWAGS